MNTRVKEDGEWKKKVTDLCNEMMRLLNECDYCGFTVGDDVVQQHVRICKLETQVKELQKVLSISDKHLYRVTIRNSWGAVKEFTITATSASDAARLINLSTNNIQWFVSSVEMV